MQIESLGLIGAGKMGGALLCALAKREASIRYVVHDRNHDKADNLAKALGGEVAESCAELGQCDLVLLATKPQDVFGALSGIEWRGDAQTLVSVAAGVQTSTLRELLPRQVRVVRAMPNTPALIGAGITAVLRHPEEELSDLVLDLFSAGGEVVPIDKESLFDAVTGLSGSGPAYIYVAIEALADGGVRMGLPRDVALQLATSTVLGSAKLVQESGRHPASLKDDVASPAGTTIAGLAALEQRGFRSALIEAVTAATERGKELGKH